MTERLVRLYLSARLLTVNTALLFSKHDSGKGNLCVCLRSCSREIQSGAEGWERCWEWRQTTHHLIMLECATTLCIFSVALVIGVVIVQTVRTEREGLWVGGWWGWQFDGVEKKNNPYFVFLRFVKLKVNFSFVTKIWKQKTDFFSPLVKCVEKLDAASFETT